MPCVSGCHLSPKPKIEFSFSLTAFDFALGFMVWILMLQLYNLHYTQKRGNCHCCYLKSFIKKIYIVKNTWPYCHCMVTTFPSQFSLFLTCLPLMHKWDLKWKKSSRLLYTKKKVPLSISILSGKSFMVSGYLMLSPSHRCFGSLWFLEFVVRYHCVVYCIYYCFNSCIVADL